MSIGKIILAAASVFGWLIFWTSLQSGLVRLSKADLLAFACFWGLCVSVVWGIKVIYRFGNKPKVREVYGK